MIFLSPMFETLVTNSTSFTNKIIPSILNVYINKYTKRILDQYAKNTEEPVSRFWACFF